MKKVEVERNLGFIFGGIILLVGSGIYFMLGVMHYVSSCEGICLQIMICPFLLADSILAIISGALLLKGKGLPGSILALISFFVSLIGVSFLTPMWYDPWLDHFYFWLGIIGLFLFLCGGIIGLLSKRNPT